MLGGYKLLFVASLAASFIIQKNKKYHNALSAVRYWSLSTCRVGVHFSGEGYHPFQFFSTVIVYPHWSSAQGQSSFRLPEKFGQKGAGRVVSANQSWWLFLDKLALSMARTPHVLPWHSSNVFKWPSSSIIELPQSPNAVKASRVSHSLSLASCGSHFSEACISHIYTLTSTFSNLHSSQDYPYPNETHNIGSCLASNLPIAHWSTKFSALPLCSSWSLHPSRPPVASVNRMESWWLCWEVVPELVCMTIYHDNTCTNNKTWWLYPSWLIPRPIWKRKK